MLCTSELDLNAWILHNSKPPSDKTGGRHANEQNELKITGIALCAALCLSKCDEPGNLSGELWV